MITQQITTASTKLIGYDIGWLQQMRQQALSDFVTLGLPIKGEAWKYTKLEPLSMMNFGLLTATKAAAINLPPLEIATYRIVLIDGFYAPELSSPRIENGLYIGALSELINTDPTQLKTLLDTTVIAADGIEALNTALFQDGVVVLVPPQVTLDKPIQVVHIYTDAVHQHMVHTRHIIQLGVGATATVIEQHLGDEQHYFNTSFLHAQLAEHAHLTYHRWQEHSLAAYHIARAQFTQASHSTIESFAFDLGGHLVRNEIHQTLAGENAYCNFNGLYLASGKQHIDNQLALNHAVPHCKSEQLYKGVLDEKAHGVFQGKVYVAPQAQKTDAAQHNANLILSDTAEIDTQPQLEIYADDVKCSHGATVGQLNEDALFYLLSRGLDKQSARQLLIYGFAAEMLPHIAEPALRNYCQARLLAHFPQAFPVPQEAACLL